MDEIVEVIIAAEIVPDLMLRDRRIGSCAGPDQFRQRFRILEMHMGQRHVIRVRADEIAGIIAGRTEGCLIVITGRIRTY